MAIPRGWKKRPDGTYESFISSGNSEVPTKLITDLDGNQKIVNANDESKVIFERGPNDKKWNTKDNNLANKLGKDKSKQLQDSANGSSYRLIQGEGSQSQKNNAKNSEAFKSAKNKLFDITPLQQEEYQPEPQASNRLPQKGGRFQYPLEMTDQQDKVRFTALSIIPGTKRTFSQKDVSIYLAAQAPIQDTNTVKWGESSQNAIEERAMEITRDSGGDFGSALKKAGDELAKAGEKYSTEIGEAMLSQAFGRPEAFTRTTKKIVNPNLELLFQGPQLRSFQMTFKMSARDESEATVIKGIIRYFKYHMSVREDGVFLKSPHVFSIQYLKGADIHQSIGLISPKISGKTRACALLSCNVDYTPLGTYSTFNDDEATMVAYTLNLQFQELDPITNKDYIEEPVGKEHSIGY